MSASLLVKHLNDQLTARKMMERVVYPSEPTYPVPKIDLRSLMRSQSRETVNTDFIAGEMPDKKLLSNDLILNHM